MTTIPQLADALQTVFGEAADRAARDSGFIQRRRKITGSGFVKALTFGWLGRPGSPLSSLARHSALPQPLAPQSLEERFTPQAADCLRRVLLEAVGKAVQADPVAVPLLGKFTSVRLLDATTIALPDALAGLWPGNTGAALKLQVTLDWCTGRLCGLDLEPGRGNDHTSAAQSAPVPAGGLRVADMGYFDQDVFRAIGESGGYWLSRLRSDIDVRLSAGGPKVGLGAWLDSQPAGPVDATVFLGGARLPARLVAVRVSDREAETRRQRLREYAKKKCRPLSARRYAAAGWNYYVTNAPAGLMGVAEVVALAKLRWQIELLFKLWKQHGRLDESRSAKPWRVLCEVYAKLLGLVVQHWALVVGGWHDDDRSPTKAAQQVTAFALPLALAIQSLRRLVATLRELLKAVRRACGINKSRKTPRDYQRLRNPEVALDGLT